MNQDKSIPMHFCVRVPAKNNFFLKQGSDNNIQKVFNQLAVKGSSFMNNFTSGKDSKQYTYQLILSSVAKSRRISTKENNDIATSNIKEYKNV
jgi:hypothetical protein